MMANCFEWAVEIMIFIAELIRHRYEYTSHAYPLFNTHIVSIIVYMYLLSSITCVSPTPNTSIKLVVGVTFQTEKECQHLTETVTGISTYRN